MCSAMVLPTLGRTFFRNNEPQLSSSVGSSIAAADTLGKTEPHAEYDFYNLAAGGLDMDSDADMSNSIGHILSTLGSQLGRAADPAHHTGFGSELRHWPVDEKRVSEPIWGEELHHHQQHHHHHHHQQQQHQQQHCYRTSDLPSSPDHFSDSGAELFDSDSDVRTPPQPPQTDCLPSPQPPPPPPPTTQLRPRISSHEDEEDALLGLQALHGLQPLHPGSGIAGGHGPTQTHDVDLDKMVTDYLGDPEELYQQALRLDELAAALTRVSPSPAPAAAPVNDSRPLGPAPAPARPSARWAGPEGGSSILEGVLRGTLSPATRVTSPPTRPLPHCYPPGGFHGYTSGGGLAPVPPRYPCDAPAGSPVRMDCALSPVTGSQDVFSPPGPLTSPQSQSKKEAARKRKYAKRNAAEGDAPPSRGRLLHFCHICSKGFKDKYSVNVHIRTHTGEKPFQCNLCNKCFRQKAHLAKHVHIHSSPKTPPAKR
ncbi:sal-like protein 2 [Amphibalanus amphitrite]|uniref:sal-like protein 2 n=1 Tax=Amphibalanus amphitrite TaxID=1232801 RepID=UPI001C909ABB|nr:sal-like protein 2 [Amphibalanus amphitrite]